MSYPSDSHNLPIKIYREISRTNSGELYPLSERAIQIGAEMEESDLTGRPTLNKRGDEASWQYWEGSLSREMGSWSSAVPAVILNGEVVPILNKNLGGDGDYTPKTLVVGGGLDDNTKVASATGEILDDGQKGIVIQCLNQDSYELIFFPTGAESRTFARIAWNFDFASDFSEAEIVTLSEETNDYIGTGAFVWIDWQKSSSTQFETAGTGTIFQISAIKTDEERDGESRALYKAIRCDQDFGLKITHAETYNTEFEYIADTIENVKPEPATGQRFTVGNALNCYYLSQDNTSANVWDDNLTSRIFTQIGEEDKINKGLARVPLDWDVARGEDFRYLEIMESGRGLPYFFQPINPELTNVELRQYSFIDDDGNTIAQYRRVSDSG